MVNSNFLNLEQSLRAC